jgi:putative tryptophan/tyrosine transport system substrate-binding protein
MTRLSRRRFVQGAGVAGLGLLAGCGLAVPWAQAPVKMHRIGYITAAERLNDQDEAFRQGLHDLGYVEGQNLVIEYRFVAGDSDRLHGFTTELIGLPVEVLIVRGIEEIEAAQNATRRVPIVFPAGDDVVGHGFVASLARPGGNLTGLEVFVLSSKRLELLAATIPGLSRVGGLVHYDERDQPTRVQDLRDAAQTLGMEVATPELRGAEDFERAFAGARNERLDAIVLLGGVQMVAYQSQVIELAAKYQVPTMYGIGDAVVAGGLMSYGVNLAAQFRRAATYVDRILKGATPADLPVERATTFDFVINLKTANDLGLTIPQHVLLQATEIIH